MGERRVELLRLAALDPKSSVSAIPPLARIRFGEVSDGSKKLLPTLRKWWVVKDLNLWPAD